jgi:hypothetical protein
MKKFLLVCFMIAGCSYSPHYALTKDSYNTYAPVYAPTTTETYAPTTTETYAPTYQQRPRPVTAPARYSAPAYPAYVYPVRVNYGYRPYGNHHRGMMRRRYR